MARVAGYIVMRDQSVTVVPLEKRSTWQWVVRGAALTALVFAGVLWSGPAAHAFDPQPDPPAFGLVGITLDETMRLSLACSQHGTRKVPAGSCEATLMFHDMAGNVVKSQDVNVQPGQATFLDLAGSELTFGEGENRVGIVPCFIPARDGGRGIPSVEVFDGRSGKTSVYVSPIPRLSLIDKANGKAMPAAAGQ